MNKYTNITLDNIENEHLCCAIADKKHQEGVMNKKAWLKDRIKEGHIFRKLDVNGKVFIEYAPLSTAWTPVEGKNFMYIYCLWVAGSYKGKGYAKELIEYAINDAKTRGFDGLCTISSGKKKPFISERKFFEKFGFKVVDNVLDYNLLSLSFNGENPKFTQTSKDIKIKDKRFTIYYSPQCPYTNNSIQEIEEYEKDNNLDFNIIKVDSLQKAKSVPCVFNNWATFIDGQFVSNTLLNRNSLEKLLNSQ